MWIYVLSFSMKVKSGSSPGDDGETLEITVYDYFVKHRNIELTSSAYMPCLNVGKPKRPNYLPVEVNNFISYFLENPRASHSRNLVLLSLWNSSSVH